jgi:ABC-2 type transport system permease protein
MSCVVAFGSGLAQERTRGTLVRLAVAPVSRRLVLVGKAFGCFLACLLVVLFLMLFGRLVLGVAIGSPWLFLMAAVASAFGFSGIMMLLAGVFRTEGAAEGAGRAVVLVLAMIGGGTIPLVFMPSIMRTVSGVSPFKWTILAIEGAVWRGFTLADMALPTLVLVGFGTIGFGLGSWFFRRAEAR